MTDEKRKDLIAALLEERRGYAMYGLADKVAGVDAELARLGAEGAPRAKRASRRVSRAEATR